MEELPIELSKTLLEMEEDMVQKGTQLKTLSNDVDFDELRKLGEKILNDRNAIRSLLNPLNDTFFQIGLTLKHAQDTLPKHTSPNLNSVTVSNQNFKESISSGTFVPSTIKGDTKKMIQLLKEVPELPFTDNLYESLPPTIHSINTNIRKFISELEKVD